MLFHVLCVGLLQVEEVIIRYSLFVRTISFADVFLQFLNGYMQVNKYVWFRYLLIDDLVKFLVKPELFFRKIHFRKKQAFGKKVIGNSDMLKEISSMNEFF